MTVWWAYENPTSTNTIYYDTWTTWETIWAFNVTSSHKSTWIERLVSFFSKKKKIKNTSYDVENFFSLIKVWSSVTNIKKATAFRKKVVAKYKQALRLWQDTICRELAEQSVWLRKEIQLVNMYWDVKYVYEEDVSDLEDRWIKDRTLYRKKLSEYKWEIPEEHIEAIVKAKDLKIFDEIVILYTRKNNNKEELELDKTKKAKKKGKRKVDPIAFWKINSTDRLYIIADWEDEECDLTVKKLDKEININTLK